MTDTDAERIEAIAQRMADDGRTRDLVADAAAAEEQRLEDAMTMSLSEVQAALQAGGQCAVERWALWLRLDHLTRGLP